MQLTVSQGQLPSDPVSPRQTKQSKKKLEEMKKFEAERLEAERKEREEAQEKLMKEQIDAFKNKNRIHLDFVHAFGNYTGPKHFDIEGQLYMLKGRFACENHQNKKSDHMDEIQQISQTINAKVNKQKLNPNEQFAKNQLIYPVGKHIALKDLDSNQMKFLLLPQDSKEVMAMTFNHKRDLLAVAVKTWVFMSQERHHINIVFYTIEEGIFKRQKQFNIKATKGADPVPLCYVDYREKQKIGGYQTKQKMYERYANSLTFSKDDKFFSVCIRNGPNECVVQSYDMLMGGKRICFGKFDYIINKITYMPRDNQKLVIAGDNCFKFYSTSQRQLVGLPEFEDMPQNSLKSPTNPQSFTSFCYRENDHLVGCTNLGDIFIIEVMDVIQVIDAQSLIAPGSKVGTRLKFKHIVNNRFGFVVASDDVLYFFQFKPNKEGSKLKGKGRYICLLKWRAPEFNGTHITSLSICESDNVKEQEDTNMAISTKNNQILYMNLYQQVYYPDHLKLINEMKQAKHVDGSESEESLIQSDDESDDTIHKIKSQGIDEENTVEAEIKKHKNLNSIELKKLAAKRENQALIDEIKYFPVASGFHTGEISYMDICIQRPIIATLSKVDSTIRVWNYDTGECELSKSYVSLQKEFASSNQTYLQSIALHPSGFYMAIGFIDKVKIYHLMQSEIRMYKSLDIKNCHTMKFSNGGQLLACVDLKDISIFNSYTLEKPKKQPGPSSQVSNIDFNDNDTLLTVVSKDGFIQKYDLTKGAAKTGECVIDKTCSFSSVIYSKLPRTGVNPNDKRQIEELNSLGFDLTYTEKVYVVGTYQNKQTGDEMMIRCYNEKDNAEDYIQVRSPFGAIRFTDILDVKGPITGKNMEDYDHSKRARNLILSLDNGRIYIYGLPPNLVNKREAYVMNTHHGSINQLKCSDDNQIVVSAGQDGTIFVYKVTEKPNDQVGAFSKKNDERTDRFNRMQRNEIMRASQDSKKKEDNEKGRINDDGEDEKPNANAQAANNSESESDEDPNDSFRKRNDEFEVIDQRLSNIVLIEKQMMDKWRQQQEELKLDMEKENNTVESSLRREKYLHETKISQMEANKSKELNKLVAEYEALQTQEAQQKDDNTQIMKKMELNHSSCMEELHSLFEKKLQIEQQQYNKLSHEKDELKQNFELEIKELTKMNEQAIEKLLNDFKDELQKVQDEYDKSKRTADGYKMIYEERLTQTEDDNEGEIDVEKNVNQKEIQQLNDVIDTIKDDIETIKRQAKREEDETKMFNDITKKAIKKKQFREEIMKEKIEEISQLEMEKKEIQEKLKEKERELYRYKFKIKDLQKTKQVLTHRTQEMKASLEPKEQQIENLKEQLLDLENVFNKQLTALHNLEFVVIPKKKQKIEEMELELKKEQARTKMREQTINQFVNKVQMASYKNKDGQQMVKSRDSKKIYENYAKLGDDEIYKIHIMEIYDTFVRKHMNEILENKKKDPETIEELNRKKQYLEKSISTLKASTSINQSKTKLNINKRRYDNVSLIANLEQVRESKKKLQNDLEERQRQIGMLKLEKQKKEREFTKKLNVIEQETLQKVRTAGLAKKENNNDPESDQIYKRVNSGEIGGFYEPSKIKGKLFKGTPFIRGNAEDKLKIAELGSQLEENNQQILLQKLEKRSLQEQIIRLLDERADDLGLSEEEKRAQLQRLNIQPFNDQNQTFGGPAYGETQQLNSSTNM